jgi:hypothetical protein
LRGMGIDMIFNYTRMYMFFTIIIGARADVGNLLRE